MSSLLLACLLCRADAIRDASDNGAILGAAERSAYHQNRRPEAFPFSGSEIKPRRTAEGRHNILDEQQLHLEAYQTSNISSMLQRTVIQPVKPIRPETLRRLSIFCYALVRDPASHEEDLVDFERNIANSCDGWDLYSTRADEKMRVIEAYPETRDNFFNRNDTFLNVWLKYIQVKLDSFDYFVKLDSDTVLRPIALRHMLMQREATRPVVLSVKGCHPGNPQKRSDGICTDGYFVAVAQAAAKRIVSLQHPENCRLAAFGDFEGRGTDEEILKSCVQFTGIVFEEPLDGEGRHLLPFERHGCPNVMPMSAEDAQALASGKALCGDEAVPTSGKTCCYSPEMAIFHGVKRKEQWRTLQQMFSAEGL